MSDGIMSKAATMEIPISSNGDTGSLPEDDGLEQDLQQVMVSGPNLNETSIVSGGYGGTAEGIIPTSTMKGTGGPGLRPGRVGRRCPIAGRWARQRVPPRGSASMQPLSQSGGSCSFLPATSLFCCRPGAP
uniref:Arfaptin-2-like protein n=1 Tax=Amazona collaria TaxID=241587 RepID=A0A8B9FYK3_9PSIT